MGRLDLPDVSRDEDRTGWAARELRVVEAEMKTWPAWVRAAARVVKIPRGG